MSRNQSEGEKVGSGQITSLTSMKLIRLDSIGATGAHRKRSKLYGEEKNASCPGRLVRWTAADCDLLLVEGSVSHEHGKCCLELKSTATTSTLTSSIKWPLKAHP